MSKVAWVLSGEGAKGSFQAAQMKRLHDAWIRPDFIVGVSSGAANACMYAAFGPEYLVNYWSKIKRITQIFGFKWLGIFSRGLFHTKPIQKMVDKSFSQGIPRCRIWFPIASATTGNVRWVSGYNGIPSAISIPGLIESPNDYFDGGTRILCPIQKAVELGATEIYVILGRRMDVTPSFDTKGLFGTVLFRFAFYGYRFLDLLMHEIIVRDITEANKNPNVKIKVIQPRDDLGSPLDFSRCKARLTAEHETIDL